ncbi:MAG: alanine--tRNA ligase, partial [Synergistaceae bacterium]|nr:alanine--tRNA ligase [Synergistaceae bacterium]
PEGRVDSVTGAGEFEVVLDTTPFYAERGGEVGDTGTMKVNGLTLTVFNTVPHGKITVHTVRLETPGTVSVGDEVMSFADDERRSAIRRNHTATHLLHEALGRVLGRHVRQAGSLVTPDILRFDFTHHSAVTDSEIAEAERIVNTQILANIPVDITEHTKDEAQSLGAKALFDEKYGDIVRVVDVPGFSMELCGGLHVSRTGDIGSFKILREESIGSGTRRILATTGMNVLAIMQKLFALRNSMTALLSTDEDGLADRAKALVDDLKAMKSQIQAAKLRELLDNSESFLEREDVNGVLLQVGRFPDIPANMLRDIGDKARARPEANIVVLASVSSEDESCQLAVMADDKAVNMGVNAGTLVKEACAILGGKGGGRKNLAQGGGKNGAKLSEALTRIRELVKSQVNG